MTERDSSLRDSSHRRAYRDTIINGWTVHLEGGATMEDLIHNTYDQPIASMHFSKLSKLEKPSKSHRPFPGGMKNRYKQSSSNIAEGNLHLRSANRLSMSEAPEGQINSAQQTDNHQCQYMFKLSEVNTRAIVTRERSEAALLKIPPVRATIAREISQEQISPTRIADNSPERGLRPDRKSEPYSGAEAGASIERQDSVKSLTETSHLQTVRHDPMASLSGEIIQHQPSDIGRETTLFDICQMKLNRQPPHPAKVSVHNQSTTLKRDSSSGKNLNLLVPTNNETDFINYEDALLVGFENSSNLQVELIKQNSDLPNMTGPQGESRNFPVPIPKTHQMTLPEVQQHPSPTLIKRNSQPVISKQGGKIKKGKMRQLLDRGQEKQRGTTCYIQETQQSSTDGAPTVVLSLENRRLSEQRSKKKFQLQPKTMSNFYKQKSLQPVHPLNQDIAACGGSELLGGYREGRNPALAGKDHRAFGMTSLGQPYSSADSTVKLKRVNSSALPYRGVSKASSGPYNMPRSRAESKLRSALSQVQACFQSRRLSSAAKKIPDAAIQTQPTPARTTKRETRVWSVNSGVPINADQDENVSLCTRGAQCDGPTPTQVFKVDKIVIMGSHEHHKEAEEPALDFSQKVAQVAAGPKLRDGEPVKVIGVVALNPGENTQFRSDYGHESGSKMKSQEVDKELLQNLRKDYSLIKDRRQHSSTNVGTFQPIEVNSAQTSSQIQKTLPRYANDQDSQAIPLQDIQSERDNNSIDDTSNGGQTTHNALNAKIHKQQFTDLLASKHTTSIEAIHAPVQNTPPTFTLGRTTPHQKTTSMQPRRPTGVKLDETGPTAQRQQKNSSYISKESFDQSEFQIRGHSSQNMNLANFTPQSSVNVSTNILNLKDDGLRGVKLSVMNQQLDTSNSMLLVNKGNYDSMLVSKKKSKKKQPLNQKSQLKDEPQFDQTSQLQIGGNAIDPLDLEAKKSKARFQTQRSRLVETFHRSRAFGAALISQSAQKLGTQQPLQNPMLAPALGNSVSTQDLGGFKNQLLIIQNKINQMDKTNSGIIYQHEQEHRTSEQKIRQIEAERLGPVPGPEQQLQIIDSCGKKIAFSQAKGRILAGGGKKGAIFNTDLPPSNFVETEEFGTTDKNGTTGMLTVIGDANTRLVSLHTTMQNSSKGRFATKMGLGSTQGGALDQSYKDLLEFHQFEKEIDANQISEEQLSTPGKRTKKSSASRKKARIPAAPPLPSKMASNAQPSHPISQQAVCGQGIIITSDLAPAPVEEKQQKFEDVASQQLVQYQLHAHLNSNKNTFRLKQSAQETLNNSLNTASFNVGAPNSSKNSNSKRSAYPVFDLRQSGNQSNHPQWLINKQAPLGEQLYPYLAQKSMQSQFQKSQHAAGVQTSALESERDHPEKASAGNMSRVSQLSNKQNTLYKAPSSDLNNVQPGPNMKRSVAKILSNVAPSSASLRDMKEGRQADEINTSRQILLDSSRGGKQSQLKNFQFEPKSTKQEHQSSTTRKIFEKIVDVPVATTLDKVTEQVNSQNLSKDHDAMYIDQQDDANKQMFDSTLRNEVTNEVPEEDQRGDTMLKHANSSLLELDSTMKLGTNVSAYADGETTDHLYQLYTQNVIEKGMTRGKENSSLEKKGGKTENDFKPSRNSDYEDTSKYNTTQMESMHPMMVFTSKYQPPQQLPVSEKKDAQSAYQVSKLATSTNFSKSMQPTRNKHMEKSRTTFYQHQLPPVSAVSSKERELMASSKQSGLTLKELQAKVQVKSSLQPVNVHDSAETYKAFLKKNPALVGLIKKTNQASKSQKTLGVPGGGSRKALHAGGHYQIRVKQRPSIFKSHNAYAAAGGGSRNLIRDKNQQVQMDLSTLQKMMKPSTAHGGETRNQGIPLPSYTAPASQQSPAGLVGRRKIIKSQERQADLVKPSSNDIHQYQCHKLLQIFDETTNKYQIGANQLQTVPTPLMQAQSQEALANNIKVTQLLEESKPSPMRDGPSQQLSSPNIIQNQYLFASNQVASKTSHSSFFGGESMDEDRAKLYQTMWDRQKQKKAELKQKLILTKCKNLQQKKGSSSMNKSQQKQELKVLLANVSAQCQNQIKGLPYPL